MWAREGRNSQTVHAFFDDLGASRAKQVTHVSAHGAEWISPWSATAPRRRYWAWGRFHVVQWATTALDDVRRGVWNELRRAGKAEQAKTLKGSRWALVKNPADFTSQQRTTLAGISADNKHMYRACLLKEQLRQVFQVKGRKGRQLLAGRLAWARRCRLPACTKLAKTIAATCR